MSGERGREPRLLLPDKEAELARRLGRAVSARLATDPGVAAWSTGVAIRLLTAVVLLLLASGIAMVVAMGVLLSLTPTGGRSLMISGGQVGLVWMLVTVVLLAVGYVRHRQSRPTLDEKGTTDAMLQGRGDLRGHPPQVVAGLAALDLIGALGGAVFDILDSIRHPEAYDEDRVPASVYAAILLRAGAGEAGLPDDPDLWPKALGGLLDPAPDRKVCKRAARALLQDGLVRERERLDAGGRHFREIGLGEAGRKLVQRFQLLPSPPVDARGPAIPPAGGGLGRSGVSPAAGRGLPSLAARIQAAVRRIPVGHVATYGQIASMAGLPRQARLVGYVLHALPEGTDVPWHRVVNARGRISLPAGSFGAAAQQALLEAEGVVFAADGSLSLARYRCPG